MATDFSNMCRALGQLSVDRHYIGRIPDSLTEWVTINEFILTLAWCISMGYADPNDTTKQLIQDSYSDYVEISGS